MCSLNKISQPDILLIDQFCTDDRRALLDTFGGVLQRHQGEKASVIMAYRETIVEDIQLRYVATCWSHSESVCSHFRHLEDTDEDEV